MKFNLFLTTKTSHKTNTWLPRLERQNTNLQVSYSQLALSSGIRQRVYPVGATARIEYYFLPFTYKTFLDFTGEKFILQVILYTHK